MDSERAGKGGFIRESAGLPGCFGVFEDDGETGYLYIYEPSGAGIVRHLHIYDRSAKVNVEPQDVEVTWSKDLSKCGVRIWGKMRGIIDLNSDKQGRVWVDDRSAPGIGDADWLEGFGSD